MTKIRTLSIALSGALALVLSGCSGASEPAPSPVETADASPPPATADPSTAPTSNSGDASTGASDDANGERPDDEAIPGDVEDMVILAVNDLTIECDNWCVSPEQDQFAEADWDAIDDRASIYQFTVYEGEQLHLTRVTEDSDVWQAWEDIIAELPEGEFIEVKPLVMTADKVACSGDGCVPAGDAFKTEGVRLLYDVSSGEAVYVGITGTH